MKTRITRRDFSKLTVTCLGLSTSGVGAAQDQRDFQVSLNERSLKRMFSSGQIDHLEFAGIAKSEFDINAVEYASSFFKSKPQDEKYLAEMNQRAAENDVRQLLIVVDSEPDLGEPSATPATAIQQYRAWIDAAKVLGCHSIGVPVTKVGNLDDRLKRSVASLTTLCEYADVKKINVIVGNNLDSSADLRFLSALLDQLKHKQCGAMLTFHALMQDNRAATITKLVPRAKAICATAKDFDERGEETTYNYRRMVAAVMDAGYRGYIGIDYQGESLEDIAGVKAAHDLLQKVRSNRP
ncbi:MAG TPA: TIM barrel protein [Pirellulaceae bacterium]|nr:TIM barrel protein [Pirellulaceae bacterium]